MRVAISAGHGQRDPGAVNEATGLIEHTNAYCISWLLRDELERRKHAVEFISCFQTLSGKIREINEAHAVKPFDLCLEIHFNSHADPKANGTEVLYFSPKNEPLAARLSSGLSKALGTRNRGAIKRDNLRFLKQTNPPAVIVEVLFISSPVDTSVMDVTFHRRVAEAIAGNL